MSELQGNLFQNALLGAILTTPWQCVYIILLRLSNIFFYFAICSYFFNILNKTLRTGPQNVQTVTFDDLLDKFSSEARLQLNIFLWLFLLTYFINYLYLLFKLSCLLLKLPWSAINRQAQDEQLKSIKVSTSYPCKDSCIMELSKLNPFQSKTNLFIRSTFVWPPWVVCVLIFLGWFL